MTRDDQRNVVVGVTLGLVSAALICAITSRKGYGQLALSGPMDPLLAKASLVCLVALIVPFFLGRLWNISSDIAVVLLVVTGLGVLIAVFVLTKADHRDALWRG